ncbi:MAG: hypothetical protein ABI361_00360 [Nitrososphaera sp.]|jgi:hypothetical protein
METSLVEKTVNRIQFESAEIGSVISISKPFVTTSGEVLAVIRTDRENAVIKRIVGPRGGLTTITVSGIAESIFDGFDFAKLWALAKKVVDGIIEGGDGGKGGGKGGGNGGGPGGGTCPTTVNVVIAPNSTTAPQIGNLSVNLNCGSQGGGQTGGSGGEIL